MDSQKIGRLDCQFPNQTQFDDLLKRWLQKNQSRHIVTLNPEMIMLAETNKSFRQAVTDADLRVPDGAGIIWARWFLRSNFWSLLPSLLAFPFIVVERTTGINCIFKLARLCAAQNKSIYLLGGTPFQVKQTADHLKKRFPKLTIHASPEHTFDIKGPTNILNHIKTHRPAVLLVAYGAPKQALWIQKHQAALASVKIAVGVGGAFAIISEDKPRAPKILRRFNLEWLWRLSLEPKRLPRIWQATVKYPLLVSRQKQSLSA